MATQLAQIAEKAKATPQMVFTSIAHLIDVGHLERSFRKLRRWAATGIDKRSYGDYEQDLQANIRDLHEWLKSSRYKAPDIRRTWIPKGDGSGKRPLGISTPEGNIISPLLCNIYLHEVLDKWIEEIRPMLKGEIFFVRFADDFVIGFEYREDAQRMYHALPKRFNKYGLVIHPEKTRLLNFSPDNKGEGRTFDFMGFTHYWTKSKRGYDVIKRRTKKAKVNKVFKAVYEYCRDNRHLPVREQWKELCMKIRGYYAYFAIPGNFKFLQQVYSNTTCYWFKWLNRRSQNNSYTWEAYKNLLKVFPLPRPWIIHKNV